MRSRIYIGEGAKIPRVHRILVLIVLIIPLACTPHVEQDIDRDVFYPEEAREAVDRQERTRPPESPSSEQDEPGVRGGSSSEPVGYQTGNRADGNERPGRIHFAPDRFEILQQETKNETLFLTVEDSVLLSLGENEQIRLASIQPRLGRTGSFGELGFFDPEPYIETSYEESRSPAATNIEGSERTADRQAFGIRGETLVGFSYDFVTDVQRSFSNSPVRDASEQYDGGFSATLTKDLFEGFTPDANLSAYYASIREARGDIQGYRAVLNEQIFQVIQAYWQYVSARRQRDISESSLDFIQQLEELTQSEVEAGQIPRVDLLQTETRRAEAEEALVVDENNVRNARDTLLEFIAPPGEEIQGWNANVEPLTELNIEPLERSEQELIETAFRTRPELREIEERIAASQRREEDLVEATRPDLNLTMGYGLESLETSRSEGWERIPRDGFRNWSLQLGFSYPLGNRTATSQLKSEDLQRRQLRIEKRQLQTQIAGEVRQAFRGVETAEARIESAQSGVNSAEQQLEAEEDRRDQGLTSTFQVLEAQTTYVDAQLRAIQARTDYMIAMVEVKQATGELVEEYGERFSP